MCATPIAMMGCLVRSSRNVQLVPWPRSFTDPAPARNLRQLGPQETTAPTPPWVPPPRVGTAA
eukprot:7108110-Pyramimonas_sp.AAC.1